jgi:multisubunit Na+/H+ antiporter MnhB subunit
MSLPGSGGSRRGVREKSSPATHLLAALLTLSLAAVLLLAVFSLPEAPGGLTPLVLERLEMSGVSHPVTAVLLNFRGYDTWLEVGVMLLALLAVLSLRRSHSLARPLPVPRASPVLSWFARLLAPVMVLVAAYLLWLGTKAPGGAFQAGAILGAAGIILRLAGYRSVDALQGPLLRVLLLSGFGLFFAVAVGVMAAGGQLLQYPMGVNSELIFLVEAAIAISTGLILVALFAGGCQAEDPAGDTGGRDRQRAP